VRRTGIVADASTPRMTRALPSVGRRFQHNRTRSASPERAATASAGGPLAMAGTSSPYARLPPEMHPGNAVLQGGDRPSCDGLTCFDQTSRTSASQ